MFGPKTGVRVIADWKRDTRYSNRAGHAILLLSYIEEIYEFKRVECNIPK